MRQQRIGRCTAGGAIASLVVAALVLVAAAACTSSEPIAAEPEVTGPPHAGQARCATERSREEGGDASTIPMADVLVGEPPEGYQPGAEAALSTEDFIDDAVKGGEENERRFRELFASTGATAVFERSFVPTAFEVDPTYELMRDETIGYGVIYAFVVCFDSVEGATTYALDGAEEQPTNGTMVSLPVTNGRLTTVRDDHAVTGLLRSGRAVITYSQWVDDGDVTIDRAAIDDLVLRQAELAGSAPT